MEHCAKHDVVYQYGAKCWCCEDLALEDREKAYADPEHLAKRGGAGIAQAAAAAHVHEVSKALSALTPEQLENLIKLVSSPSAPAAV